MKSIAAVSVSLCLIVAGCGGGGSESAPDSTVTPTPQPSTSAPPVLLASANPLNLSPAPQFTSSNRSVVYDDCFQDLNDLLVGDVATSRNEDVDGTKTITPYDTVTTITKVVPATVPDRIGVSVDTVVPPSTIPRTPVASRSLENRTTNIVLRGSTWPAISKNYGAFGDEQTISTMKPTSLGDISSGHALIAFALGDSETTTYAYDNTVVYNGLLNSGTLKISTTFIGVDEGTKVIGGSFPYTCVFRRTMTGITGTQGTTVADTYFHKWGIAKTIYYSALAPRPLVGQMVSDTGYDRRKAAGR